MKHFALLSLITSICIVSVAFAQSEPTQTIGPSIENTKQHRMLVQTTGLYNLILPKDIERYSTVPNFKPALSVNNTFGYQFGLSYEYRNRHNITFSPGVLYGMQRLSYDNHFTTGHLPPPTYVLSLTQLRLSAHYLGTSFALGYDCQLPKSKNITLQVKLGLSTMFSLKPSFESQWYVFATHLKEGNDTNYIFHYGTMDITRRKSEIGFPFYSVYLGGTYKVEASLVKDVRIGLSFIHCFGFFADEGYLGSYGNAYYDLTPQWVASEQYLDRFRNIGFTVTVGF